MRTALNAVQAAQAALTLGAGLGISQFERITFVQRNGLAYAATYTGTILTGNNPGISLLSRGAATWVERVRSRSDKLGKAVRDGLHRFDAALFAYARLSSATSAGQKLARARACGDVLVGLADIEFAIARRGHEDLRPFEYLDAAILPLVDDGSIEHRIALALMSLGYPQREREMRLRVEHVRYDEHRRLVYAPDAKISFSPSVEDMLGDICERRTTAAESETGGIAWLRGAAGLGAQDIALLSEGLLDKKHRLAELIQAYALVRPSSAPYPETPRGIDAQDETIPAAFALIKLVLDHPKACDRRIITLLRAGQVPRALALALQRARSVADLPAAPRNITAARVPNPHWYAAAMLVPIRLTAFDYAPLLNASLSRRFNLSHPPDREAVNSYLASIQIQKEAA